MFEDSRSWQRVKGGGSRPIRVNLGFVPLLEEDPREERRSLRIAVAVALAFHLVLFLVHLPEMAAKPLRAGPAKPVYVVKQVRFKPPPPQRQQVAPPKEKRRKIPIPDPTPDDPEPIIQEEVELPEAELSDVDLPFGIPEGPPGPGFGPMGPLPVGGNVRPPEKIYYPSPHYTEEARRAQLQGVVILEAVIDAEGAVRRVKVLKGLPAGLSESAVETVKEWKFKPATLEGEPVAVIFNLTVSFSLQ